MHQLRRTAWDNRVAQVLADHLGAAGLPGGAAAANTG